MKESETMKDRIIEALQGKEKAVDLIEINKYLKLKTTEELDELDKTIEDLIKEGILHETKKKRFILVHNCKSLVSGRIDMAKNGYAFLEIDSQPDVYISKSNLNGAIENDLVLADVYKVDGKREAKVIKVLDRKMDQLVGEVVFINGKPSLVLDDKKVNINIDVNFEDYPNLVDGHKIAIKLISQLNDKKYKGEIISVIGHKNDPDVDILSIAFNHGITLEFSDETKEELDNIPDEVLVTEKINRRDLTKEMIFTIDGDDTKDIDDAISISYENNIYTLGVHIADVTNYVRPNTALYKDAYQKGTSSYLADRVLPMLPHELSNGICSLNPKVERLALSCVMKIDENGKIVDHEIFPSVIKSRKQMTYKCVNSILMKNEVPEGYEEYKDPLLLMQKLAHILRKRKIEKGYIEFAIDEPKIIQDELGKCIGIAKHQQFEGEKLIEDFMIAANETVATHITNMDLPFIYRIHGTPKPEKIEDFINLMKLLNVSVNTKNISVSSKGMQTIIESIKDREDFKILSSMLLRCMQKAIYSTNNIGHFGLALNDYTHFTSPIRRFPDLTVHQLLKTYLFNNDLNSGTIDFYSKYLIEVADYSSEREQAAVSAEREVDDMKMAEFMMDHIGEEFEGIITTVTNFGFYVELENLIEGLVHVSTLKGFFNYVPDLLSLISNDKKTTYRIGDKVKIRVTNANKDTRTIDFEVV